MPGVEDFSAQAADLLDAAARISERRWCPATGGNFSVRVDSEYRLITQSGRDKARLSAQDLMLCDVNGKAVQAGDKPSDETALHMRVYQLQKSASCVLHSHSVFATVSSRAVTSDHLRLQGFEMQKALGQGDPKDPLILKILDNNQNIAELADELEEAWNSGDILCPGFLVRGHGLYAWGDSTQSAWRHLEAFEFLLECAWQERLLHRKHQ